MYYNTIAQASECQQLEIDLRSEKGNINAWINHVTRLI